MWIEIKRGYYKNNELATLLQIDNNKNFKRNVIKIFQENNCKQDVDYDLSQQGRCIIYHNLGVFTKIKERNIALFLYCTVKDEYFNTMLWIKKSEYIKDKFGIDIAERTLQAIRTNLVDKNILEKDILNFSIWCTERDGIDRIRYKIEENDVKYIEWKNFLKETKGIIEPEIDEDKINIYKEAWDELGRTYTKSYGYRVKIGRIKDVTNVVSKVEDIVNK